MLNGEKEVKIYDFSECLPVITADSGQCLWTDIFICPYLILLKQSLFFWQGYVCHCHRQISAPCNIFWQKVLCNSSCIWAPIGSIWQWMTLQKYLIRFEFTRRTTDIAGFLLAQDATVCNFFLLYCGGEMWLSMSCFWSWMSLPC